MLSWGRFPICGERGLLEPSRGRVPFARRVLPAEKEKAADSQLMTQVWKADGFLLISGFLGGAKQNFFFPAGKYLGGEVRRGGEARVLAEGASSQPRFCFTKPAPQKGALPPWKGDLWDLPRLLGDLYRKPPETFTQPPAEKTGRKQKNGASSLGKPGGKPRYEP